MTKKTYPSARLIFKFLNNELTADEQNQLDKWLKEDENKAFFAKATNRELLLAELREYRLLDKNKGKAIAAMTKRIFPDNAANEPAFHKGGMPVWAKWTWGMAAAVVIAFVVYLFITEREKNRNKLVQPADGLYKEINPAPIPPGGYKASLRLADGEEILLDGKTNFNHVEKNGAKLTVDTGVVLYQYNLRNPVEGSTGKLYNMLTTPRGGEFTVKLPDKSLVKLNAASSIRFPVVFDKNNRQVEITGEAYFEIARDIKRPFRIKIIQPGGDSAEVEVLGTHFNIKAYPEEKAIIASLYEGKIKFKTRKKNITLVPNQAVSLDTNGKMELDKINYDEDMEWSSGNFNFEAQDIRSIMNQIGRWYDVGVELEENLPPDKFDGSVSRNRSLSEVLEMLNKDGKLRFIITGKKIIVQRAPAMKKGF